MVTSNNDSAATPVFQGNRLLVSGLMLDVSADPPAAVFRWPEIRAPSKRVLSNTSTAVLQGEYIFSARGSGELVCLEAATGRQIWGANSLTASQRFNSWRGKSLQLAREQLGRDLPASSLGGKETSLHLARLWARDEVLRLAGARKFNEAMQLAARYQLVTAVSGAVVLETKAQYERAGLKPAEAATVPVVPVPETWMLMLLAFAVFVPRFVRIHRGLRTV